MIAAALEGLGALLLVVAQFVLFARALDAGTEYDEGVYLASLSDLLAGQELATEVATAQPPAFYYGLRLAAGVFGNSVEGIRTAILLVFVCGAVGAYLLGRSLGGRLGGLLAVALVGLAPPVPLFGVRVLADLPSIWLMLLALGLGSLKPGDGRLRVGLAGAGGAILGLAVFVKPTAAIGLVPLAILLARGTRGRRALLAAAAGLAGTTAAFVLVNLGKLHELWQGIVVYRRRASELPDLLTYSDLVEQVLNQRAAFTGILALAVAAAATVVARSRSFGPLADLAAPVALLVLACLAIAAYRPLHANHVVLLSETLAVAAATTIGCAAGVLGRRAALVLAVLAVLLVAPAYAQAWSRVSTEIPPPDAEVVALAERLAAVTDVGSLVVSDQPIVAYLARRETPGPLVDIAELRIATGLLSESRILRELDERCVAAVVVARAMGTRPGLVAEIRRRFRNREMTPAGVLFYGRLHQCDSDATRP